MIQRTYFYFLFLVVFFSCSKENLELEIPSKFQYEKARLAESEIFTVKNSQLDSYKGSDHPFVRDVGLLKDSLNTIVNAIFEIPIIQFTSFQFIDNSEIKVFTKVGNQEASLTTSYSIDGVMLPIQDLPLIMKFNDDFSELSLCGQIVILSDKIGNKETIYLQDFEYCQNNLTLLQSAKLKLNSILSGEITFVYIQRFDFVYKKI